MSSIVSPQRLTTSRRFANWADANPPPPPADHPWVARNLGVPVEEGVELSGKLALEAPQKDRQTTVIDV